MASVCVVASLAAAQTLPGTGPLTLTGDPAAQMVAGISRWLLRETAASTASRHPTRERLRGLIGAVDERVPFAAPEVLGAAAETPSYIVRRVRWPVLDGVTAEGLWYEPRKAPSARVVVLPDADQEPEEAVFAARLAAGGCEVLAPVLMDRRDTWSGNPLFHMTNQPHREFLYRMGFPLGRTIIGYEVQKTLAAVDWFSRREPKAPVDVWGYGEGALIALYAAALDGRMETVGLSGYFGPRENLWREPIYRNVWSLLRDFGDAEVAGLVRARIVVDGRPGPRVSGPPPETRDRRGAAPGVLEPVAPEAVAGEVRRARRLGARIDLVANAESAFPAAQAQAPPVDSDFALARRHRQFHELVDHMQRLLRASRADRDRLWAKADPAAMRGRVWEEMIGRLPAPSVPLNPRSRHAYQDAKWDGYEITLDVFPDVFAYGVLLVPKGLPPGERRPVVVAQHGLEGRPQHLFAQPEVDREGERYTNFHFYQNIGSRLADMGYVVYLPQNPYTGDFRFLQRQANPLRLSIFSFILAQNERLLDWLATLPYVDAKRIGFYGLSYGGKTALRIPAMLERYALSICSGDFNEWVVKLATIEEPFSYLFTQEYEMDEWNLAHLASHAELAYLIAPRPFMVERGHRDGVGIDEWVAYEYARVRRYYDEHGIGERTRIEHFNGPHMIHGVGTIEFLQRFLRP